jgi:hypothetical protein
LNIFITLKRNPITHFQLLPLNFFSLRQLLICSLSIQICLLWISYKWSHKYVVFLVWFLSLGTMFPRFIYIATCHSFYGQVILHYIDMPHFIYLVTIMMVVTKWWHLGCSHLLNNAVMNIHVDAFEWTSVFISFAYIYLGVELQGVVVLL